MKDIVPELLNRVEAEFEKSFVKSTTIKDVITKIENKTATYKEANQLAVEVGEILANAFKMHVSSDNLPNGKMYYNIAERLLNKTLGNNHDIIAKTCVQIQANLNKSSKLNIKALAPELNQNKIDGLIEKAVNADKYDDVAWALDEPVVNFSQSIVNDAIKQNVEFHHELGLSPKIVRRSAGNCCDWCNKLAGVYDYPDNVPKDIYRIHQRCRCTVEYHPKNGRVENVHTKKTRIATFEDEKEIRIHLSKQRQNNKLRRIAYSQSKKSGYDPLSHDEVVNVMRKDHEDWIKRLSSDEKNAITKYCFNGVDGDGQKWFEKINGYLLGRYTPANVTEENTLQSHIKHIRKAILKNDLKHDIIVYRNESNFKFLNGNVNKFLSTSVTSKGALGSEPNVALIIPKKTKGAYIEALSHKPKQREFLMLNDFDLNELHSEGGLKIYEVKLNEQ